MDLPIKTIRINNRGTPDIFVGILFTLHKFNPLPYTRVYRLIKFGHLI